jgi:hypothetical protein
MQALNEQLIGLGYVAGQESSLQIRHLEDEQISYRRADLLISSVMPPILAKPNDAEAFNESVSATVLLAPIETDSTQPLAIYIAPIHHHKQPVVWIEVLSPANKEGEGRRDYIKKRMDLLRNGLVFVELDYLQGSSTSLESVIPYRPTRRSSPNPNGFPYHIWWIDPRIPPSDPHSGHLSAIPVDHPLPQIRIPLKLGEHFSFDFNRPYHYSVANQPSYTLELDYALPPLHVAEDYNLRDQARIAARMVHIREHGFADPPQPVDPAVWQALYNSPERLAAFWHDPTTLTLADLVAE